MRTILKRVMMYKQQIKTVVGVALKHFFDLDAATLYMNFQMMSAGFKTLAQLAVMKTTLALADGMDTVREDAYELKTWAQEYRELWEDSDLRATVTNNLRHLKLNIGGKTYAGN